MAVGPRRGEIWQYRFDRPDKRRPVVILTRQEVLPLLRTAMVAPITSTIRGIPSEVLVGPDEGLKHHSAINLDHVQTVEQSIPLQARAGLAQSPKVMTRLHRLIADIVNEGTFQRVRSRMPELARESLQDRQVGRAFQI